MRVLLAEDDKRLGKLIQYMLEQNDIQVEWVTNGSDIYEYAMYTDYDILILDWMMPGETGVEACSRLRKDGYEKAILMLTARDSVEDRVTGLDAGADDYLVKPFAFSELLARVRTLLRRGSAPSQPDRIQVADLVLDLPRRRATRAGQRINLTSKEFALLELLARRQGEVLPRSLIASQVWDMNFDSDSNVIDVAIRRLRAKIDDTFNPKLIHTVRGMGYTLDAPDDAPAP